MLRKLLTVPKSPRSAALGTIAASKNRCTDPLSMKNTFAAPMNRTPRPTVLAAASSLMA